MVPDSGAGTATGGNVGYFAGEHNDARAWRRDGVSDATWDKDEDDVQSLFRVETV